MCPCHQSLPDWSRAFGAGNVFHFAVIGVADPDAGNELRCVADCPRIAVVVGSASFGSNRAIRQFEGVGTAKRGQRAVVSESMSFIRNASCGVRIWR